MYTGETGKLMDKAQYLADAKATKYASMNYTGMTIDVFGDTAIARGEARYTGTDASGKRMDGAVRFTDTWVSTHQGKWECVASHVSSVSN
jgi:ketosteroid isomerase-like protein